MKKIYNLDDRISRGKYLNTKRVLFINKKIATIPGLIDYFIKENNPRSDEFDNIDKTSIAELGYIENDKQIGIIIPKIGTKIEYSPLMIGRSIIITFGKTKGNNKNLQIYETERFYKLEKIIKNTIKKGKFIKSETIPKEFSKYIY